MSTERKRGKASFRSIRSIRRRSNCQMAASLDANCDVESGSFRRTPSRVFFQSDCSSPTSWEFRGLSSPPVPMRLSVLRVSASETTGGSSKGESRIVNGSRNSTGSSTGSHRSQDSGFSDSGETRGQQQQQRANSQHLEQTYSQNHVEILNRSCERSPQSELSIQLVTEQNCTSSTLPYRCQQFYPSPSQKPAMVNGSQGQYRHFKKNSCPNSLPCEPECTDCIYQEVILARSVNGAEMSPIPQDISVNLGAPTCCSTPKHTQKSSIRLSAMQKIDNFESLNKNKLLDSNNNSSCKENSRNNILQGEERELSLISQQPVPPASVNRISSPTRSSHSTRSWKSNGTSLKSVDCCKEDLNGTIDKSPSSYPSRSLAHTSCSSKSSKWQSLPKGFQRVPAPNPAQDLIIVRSQADNDAMRLWLHELRHQAEPECLHTLQTKAIVSESPRLSYGQNPFSNSPISPSRLNVTALAIHSVSAPLLSIRNVEQMACVISGEFSKICKHLEFGFFAQVPALVENLWDQLSEFLKHFHESFGNLQKLENRLATSCYELRVAAQSLQDLLLSSSGIQAHRNNTNPSPDSSQISQNVYAVVGHEHERQFHLVVGEIVEGIVALGNLFGQVVDQRLTRDLSSILDTIENGGLPARVGLKSFVTVLNDGGMHICRLASSIRTVRGLLGALLDAKEDHDKVLALRCLATILCVGEAVKDFDKAGGFEIVADILFDPTFANTVKYEAVSVLTQATDPWIDLETTLANLGYHLEKIIVSLTNMIPQCQTHEETFLLTIAAISNLTFLEVSSLNYLRRYRTISLIINAIREKPDFSIFVLDHVATVLANMAGSEGCRKDIVASGGIVTLLCFLQQRPSPSESAAEIAACERLQQKSTIAISRLCNEDGVAKMVMEMNGMQRMIQLCRQDKERNYSDGVLIACLATLRKLVTFCGDGVVQGLHAEDLIQPRLLDSFLLYSSRQESYV